MDSTHTGVISSTALQIARDCLAGYWGDYAFYCSSENTYDLVKFSEYTEENGTYNFSGSGLSLVRIVYRPADWQQNIQTDYFVYYASPISVTFENPDSELMYSSLADFPKLQEGGDYLAFSTFTVLCVACFFCLFARIFRNVL